MTILSGLVLPTAAAPPRPLMPPQQLKALIVQHASPDQVQLRGLNPGTMPAIAPSVSGKQTVLPAIETKQFAGQPVTLFWDQRFKAGPKAPRIPTGYGTIKGTLPPGLSKTSSYILKQGNPLGTYTPFTLNGKSYLAINEYHSHYAGRPNEPVRKIYAITVFEKN